MPAKSNLAANSRKGEVQNRVEKGSPGERRALQHKTGIVGERMWRPYAPPWHQGTGEGEVERGTVRIKCLSQEHNVDLEFSVLIIRLLHLPT